MRISEYLTSLLIVTMLQSGGIIVLILQMRKMMLKDKTRPSLRVSK